MLGRGAGVPFHHALHGPAGASRPLRVPLKGRILSAALFPLHLCEKPGSGAAFANGAIFALSYTPRAV